MSRRMAKKRARSFPAVNDSSENLPFAATNFEPESETKRSGLYCERERDKKKREKERRDFDVKESIKTTIRTSTHVRTKTVISSGSSLFPPVALTIFVLTVVEEGVDMMDNLC